MMADIMPVAATPLDPAAGLQVLQSKYRQAVAAALAALRLPPPLRVPRLPHIYGSAEYLGDSSAGLQAPAQQALQRSASEAPSDAPLMLDPHTDGSLAADLTDYDSDVLEGEGLSTVGSLLGPTMVRSTKQS